MQEDPADEVEMKSKGRPKFLKSKSAASGDLLKNIDFKMDPGSQETVDLIPKNESSAPKMNGYHEDSETLDKEEHKAKVRHERSSSFAKHRRLEARPLRRSSIASVRRSDKTVREKGKGYTFDDDLGDEASNKKVLPPLKMPLGDQGRIDSERPLTPGADEDIPRTVFVEINLDDTSPKEKRKKEKDEKQNLIDAVKSAAAGKSWLRKQDAQEGMVQKLGTLERTKVKQRRAMYPPLSMVINPEDKETQVALEEIGQMANGTANMRLKVVDIAIDDVTPAPVSDKKGAGQAKSGPKTVSMTTANDSSTARNLPSSSTSATNFKPKKPTGGLVASRTARLTNLIANDFRPPTVKDKWAEREENLKPPSPVQKEEPEIEKLKIEEKPAPGGSPGAQRRSLPRVPAEEPFHSTKETTKIANTKQKPPEKSKFPFRKGKKKGKKAEKEDMGFIVLDLQDGITTPEREALAAQQEGEVVLSESSEDDLIDENSPKLQRTNARRFGKPRRNTETPEDKTKRREQSRIRSAMKQRESKRLRMAQSIQRELEEVAVKQADLEKEGIVVEKALRSGSTGGAEEQHLMLQWFKLVNRKNALIRFESELVIHANSIQLEDQQGRLEQEIRELLMKEDHSKLDNRAIQQKTKQLVDIVEQRNALVELLDEERKREQEEDRLFDAMIEAKGFITTV